MSDNSLSDHGLTRGLPLVRGTTTPAAPSSTPTAGVASTAAPMDHSHPSRIPTVAPANPVNGDFWMV